MARRPSDEDRVTDLARYRKAREQARRQAAPSSPARQGLLGSNPRAPLILLAVVLILVLLFGVPVLLNR